MNIFQRIANWFKRGANRKKKQEEWAARFDQPPAKPDNLTPLDPGNDPWRT